MHPTATLFPLAALLSCLPAMGQEDGPKPVPKTIHFEVQASADGFAAILLAPDDRLMQFGNQVVLADGNLVLLTKQEQGKFAYDMEIPVEVTSDLHWQAVTWDSAKGLQIKAPQKIELDSAADSPVVNRIPAPGGPMEPQVQVVHETGEGTKAGTKTGSDAAAGVSPTEEPQAAATRLEIALLGNDEGFAATLWAGFSATRTGYGLRADLRANEEGGVDVFLYRKLPGADEGKPGVSERHEIELDLVPGTQLRILLAEGTDAKPADAQAFKVIAEFDM